MHAISASCHALALHDHNIKRCFRSVKLISLIRGYARRYPRHNNTCTAFDPDGLYAYNINNATAVALTLGFILARSGPIHELLGWLEVASLGRSL